MNVSQSLRMLVCWKKQRRFIQISVADDLNKIEQSIIRQYRSQMVATSFDQYQIQFYHQTYEKYVDLYEETFDLFRQILDTLQSNDKPLTSKKIWRLKIVPKAIRITDERHNQIAIKRQLSTSSENQSIDHSLAPISPSSLKMEDSQRMISRLSTDTMTTNSSTMNLINQEHPLDLHFHINLAERQRTQYESEMNRKSSSKHHGIAGVLLRGARSQMNLDSDPCLYPTVQFRIPHDLMNASWSIYVYVLTECDGHGTYYLHASKGIYDQLTLTEDRFGGIPNSKLVNPFVIDLSRYDIQQETFQLRLRICNIRNLPLHRREKLRRFPELHRFMIFQDNQLLSNMTSADLNFSSRKYHLGCILVSDHVAQDRCISRLAMEVNNRELNNHESKVEKKKIRIESQH